MKRHYWKFAFLFLVPLALYAVLVKQHESWRPKTIGVSGAKFDSVKFSPQGRFLVLEAQDSDGVFLIDANTRREVFRLKNKFKPCFLSEQRLVVGGIDDKDAAVARPMIYSVPDGKRLAVGPKGYGVVTALKDGRTILLSKQMPSPTLQIFAWDSVAKSPPHLYMTLPKVEVNTTKPDWLKSEGQTSVFADDNVFLGDYEIASSEWFACLSEFPLGLECWSLQRKKLYFRTPKTAMSLKDYAFSPCGLCVLYDGNRANIWNYKTGQLLKSVSVNFPADPDTQVITTEGDRISLSPDGTCLAVGSYMSRRILLWDMKTGRIMHQLNIPDHSGTIDLKFAPDGRTLAHCSKSGAVNLWRIK